MEYSELVLSQMQHRPRDRPAHTREKKEKIFSFEVQLKFEIQNNPEISSDA